VIIDLIRHRRPRVRPNGGIARMYLVDRIGVQVMFNLHNRRPIDGSGALGRRIPEGIRRVVFGFKNIR